MKRELTAALVFNPAAGTLDCSAIPNFDVRRLSAVLNTKTMTWVYGPFVGYGATAVVGGVVTLQAPVGGMAATDPLYVAYDDSTGKVAEDASVQALATAFGSFASANHGDLGALLSATQAVTAAIRAQIDVAPLFVTDGTSTYVRRESVAEGTGAITVTFENMDGSAATPVVANLSPITSKSRVAAPVYYDVVTPATGYSATDTLAEVVITDTVTGGIVATWQNLTQATTLAGPPPSGNIRKQRNSISLDAQTAGLALDATVQALVSVFGSSADPATALTAIGLLKAILAHTPALGAALATASTPVALATDQLAVLAKDASLQTLHGDLGAIRTQLGTAPAQDATLGQAVALLNNIQTALALLGTDVDVQATTAKVEAVRALLAGTIKVDPSAVTTPISAAALPLPAGAATEGTLATIKQILAAQASIAESTWYDPTVTPNAFYFRRVVNTDGVVTEVWTDPTGAQVGFNANWKPLSSSASYQVLPAVAYDCVTAFTGASVSDVIVRVIILNLGVSPPTIAATMWLNANTGAALSSVTMANLKEVTRDISIPDGYFVSFGALADAAAANPAAGGSFMSTFRGFWTDFRARAPAIGQATAANSLPVVLSSDGPFSTNFGLTTDNPATSDAGAWSLIALIKRGLGNWTTLLQRVPALGTAIMTGSLPITLATDDKMALAIGGAADAAANADAGTFSLVAMAKRIAARLTTLIGLLPASLGQKPSAASLPVVLASDAVVATKPIAPTPATSGGYATALQARVGAGTVVNIQASNSSQTVEGYVVAIDAAQAPALNAVINPIKQRRLLTNDGTIDGLSEIDTPFAVANGCAVLLTTSLTTYTPGGLSGVINATTTA